MLFIIENKNLRLNIALNTDIQTKAINKERFFKHTIDVVSCYNTLVSDYLQVTTSIVD